MLVGNVLLVNIVILVLPVVLIVLLVHGLMLVMFRQDLEFVHSHYVVILITVLMALKQPVRQENIQ